jgi:spermidine synthase
VYEELDHRPTPLGDLVLRRRSLPGRDAERVTEVVLDGAFLMSSVVRESEEALARWGLAAAAGTDLDVLVGGLGLGYTAKAALEDARVRRLRVVERLPAVIRWHEEGRLPLGRALVEDPRCALLEGDFFAVVGAPPEEGGVDALLVDIDHSPRALLDAAHSAFYEVAGLAAARRWLRPGGVLALWSADAPDRGFLARLERVFPGAEARPVAFENPMVAATDLNTIYLATRPA